MSFALLFTCLLLLFMALLVVLYMLYLPINGIIGPFWVLFLGLASNMALCSLLFYHENGHYLPFTLYGYICIDIPYRKCYVNLRSTLFLDLFWTCFGPFRSRKCHFMAHFTHPKHTSKNTIIMILKLIICPCIPVGILLLLYIKE